MSTLKFDVPAPTPPAILDAAITSVQVLDLDGNPNLVVEAGAGFNVPVRWHLTGVLAPLVINDWHVRLFAESIGVGFEGKLAEVTAAVPTLVSPTDVQYDAVLSVPAARSGYGLRTSITMPSANPAIVSRTLTTLSCEMTTTSS